MSKQVKRKITVNITAKSKAVTKTRPSVFERLGTKAGSTHKDFCHHWAQHGTCPYGKSCKYSITHTLISPSKQRAAKESESKKRHPKDNAHKRVHGVVLNQGHGSDAEWTNDWDPDELAEADPDDLEKRRAELQRELELQMKMETKSHKKPKKVKKESSPSTESSSSSSDSTSSSEESTSSSSSSIEVRRKKTKKNKSKRETSTSSDEKAQKHKSKSKRSKSLIKPEKSKKPKALVRIETKSPTPTPSRRHSQTPPLKSKLTPTIKKKSESTSPRPPSRSSDRKEKRRTPSPKPKEKDKEREKEKEREREREREREKEKMRLKEKERKRDRTPKRDIKPKDTKKKDSPDSTHSRDRKSSPSRSRGSGSSSSRRDNHRSNSVSNKDDRKLKDDKSKTKTDVKHKRDSRDRERDREREREKERERRQAREAAREKEREEALARCQERQRERERLKELAKKEEERSRNRDRSRRDDRGLDKPVGDRVERLLPLPADRVPPNRKDHSVENDRRDRDRRDRSSERGRSSRKSLDRDRLERMDRDKDRQDRNIDRYDRSIDRTYDREQDRELDRDYSGVPRLRDSEHRHEEKRYDSPYERSRIDDRDRRYLEMDHYNETVRDERIPLDNREYADDRRQRREMWDERGIERERELDHRRYGREDNRAVGLNRGREWGNEEYVEHDSWDRSRRAEWDDRKAWDNRELENPILEDEYNRHYNRPMDTWSNDDRRRWPNEWREREISRPRSSTSHREDDALLETRRKEVPRQETHVETKPIPEAEVKKETQTKRPAEQSLDGAPEAKKTCPNDAPLEDDLSEISDDADEILNRDEEVNEQAAETPVEDVKPATELLQNEASVPVQSQNTSSRENTPNRIIKEEAIDEENMDLDFEEISEDELEEEIRVKGLGDALGVDWASLVAESRPRVKPVSSAKGRWESNNVLVNIGVSVEMAGEALVKEILKEHGESNVQEEQQINGIKLEVTDAPESPDVAISHPIAAIQVAHREKEAVRKSLFASAGPHRRALSARRDLLIRRHLCHLPVKDAFVEAPKRHNPELFKLATKLFERCL